ncbi:nuclear transcription factor Y subunit beta [Drosophila tropicalis]|uniref:nuclear transcription factor Y subunit beta n=1 Tax=Drosophila tropicalis TaxID=46794 RepID=UPI0035AC009D
MANQIVGQQQQQQQKNVQDNNQKQQDQQQQQQQEEEDDDLRSTSSSKMNFVCRLDRWLRRWLPGYNYIRGASKMPRSETDLSANPSGSLGTTIVTDQVSKAAQKRKQQQQVKLDRQQQKQQQQQKKSEVYLSTGIAKSEFCVKLENILKTKLNKQEQKCMEVGD